MYCDKSGTVLQDAGPPTARDVVTRRSGPLCASASEASKLSPLAARQTGTPPRSVATKVMANRHADERRPTLA